MTIQNVYRSLILTGLFVLSSFTTHMQASSDLPTRYGILTTAVLVTYGGLYWISKDPRKKNEESFIEKVARTTSGLLLASAGIALFVKSNTVQEKGFRITLIQLSNFFKHMKSKTLIES